MLKKLVSSVVAFLVLASFASACGGNSDSNDGITGVPKATEAEVATPPVELSEGTVTKADLYSCIEDTELKLSKEAGKVPGTAGHYRTILELDGAEYAGFVVWPSGNIADIWIGADSDGVDDAREQFLGMYETYGQRDKGEQLVQASGNVLIGLDDEEPPTPDEAAILNACLEPT